MQNKITGIIGPKGSGKTHLAAILFAHCPRVAVFNIVREDSAYLAGATDIFEGNLPAFAKALENEEFRYVLRPARYEIMDEEITFPEFEAFVRLCFARKGMCMMIDEAHLLCNPRSIPHPLAISFIIGRHRELNIVYITQRFAMVHPVMRSNTDEFFFWKIHEPGDLAAIRERCGNEVSERVQGLRRLNNENGVITPGESLHWTTLNGIENEKA